MKPLPALTGIRFFLALFVLLHHAGVAPLGYVSVNAFFLLSGFVLCYSYVDDTGQLRTNLRSFFIARVARIYPVYLLAIALTLPHQFAQEWTRHGPLWALTDLLVVSVGLQSWFPAFSLTLNPAAWSLSVELALYCAFPFLIVAVRKLEGTYTLIRAMIGCWLLSMAMPGAYLIGLHYGYAQRGGESLIKVVMFNPLFHIPTFVMGILAARLFLIMPKYRWLNISPILIFLVLYYAKDDRQHVLFHNGALSLLLVGLFLSLANGGLLSKLLSFRFVTLLGEASYAMYLLHMPLDGLTESLCSGIHFQSVAITFTAIVMVSISLVVLTQVERPYRILINRRWA